MLPQGSLLELKKTLTPSQFAHTLQAGGPVYWWEAGGFFVVTDYRLAERVMREPQFSADRSQFFISRMPNLDLRLIKDFFGVVQKMMVMSDGGAHSARRRVGGVGLTDELMNSYRERIDALVQELLAPAAARGELEFVSELAEKLPSRVLAELFHIPEEARGDFYRWSHNMTQFFGGASQYRNEDGVEVNASAVAIRDFFRRLLEERRRQPGSDFLSRMIGFQERAGLTDEEVVSQAVMMLVAGQITTTDQMANNICQLLERPELWEALARNPESIGGYVEEFTRLDPAVTFVFRVAREAVVLGGVSIPQGGVVFISTHAVDRDPKVFPDPETLDPSRPGNLHFGYGHGPHYCLGAKLARVQMQAVVRCLTQGFSAPKDRLESRRKHDSLAFSGFESLRFPVTKRYHVPSGTPVPAGTTYLVKLMRWGETADKAGRNFETHGRPSPTEIGTRHAAT